MRHAEALVVSAVAGGVGQVLAHDQAVHRAHELRALPVTHVQRGRAPARGGRRQLPARAARLRARLRHGLLDSVGQLGGEGLGQVEDEPGRHEAEEAEGEEGEEAGHGGQQQVPQQQHLRRQQRAQPPEQRAGAHAHGADDGGEDLAAVEEDDAEAGDHGGLAEQRERRHDGGHVSGVQGEEVAELELEKGPSEGS